MGFFSSKGKKPVGISADELAALSTEDFQEVVRSGQLSGTAHRKVVDRRKQEARAVLGEKGLKALMSAFDGSGADNYRNLPASARVHPSRIRAGASKPGVKPVTLTAAERKAFEDYERRRRR